MELRVTSISPGLLEATEESLKELTLPVSPCALTLRHVTLFGTRERRVCHLNLRGYLGHLSFIHGAWQVGNLKSLAINPQKFKISFPLRTLVDETALP